MKSGGFHHEIRRISWNPWNPADFTQISPVKSTQNYKSKCFSKNSSVWWMQGGGFQLVDFTHEIWWISPRFHLWNPPKIIKASVSAKTLQFDECRVGDFTLEIQQISPWNLVDFTCEIWQISPRFHLWNPPKIIKASVLAKTLQFDECRVGAMTKDFMKFTLKSGGFHPWNLADFTCEIHLNYKSKCFSKNSSVWWMQGGDFTLEIWWISPWNLVDFNHEIWWISPRFHLWNPPKIIKASVSAKTLQFDECRVGDFTIEIQWISPWNLVDFNHEIWWISPRFHL